MTVYLVGAGPGDPGLLTRRGAALLARADVVLHDRLVSPAVLELAPASALVLDVGKDPDTPSGGASRQEEITRLLVEHARRAAVVVRLKGGDPFLFGRAGEEVEALARAGIDWEVVPGVTSAFGVPAAAGIPVTQRGLAASVTVVTGRVGEPDGTDDHDWAALSRAGGTLVILMGMATRRAIAAALMDGGRAPDTPVAVIARGTTPSQRVVRTTLKALADVELGSPAVIVVGPVAALGRDDAAVGSRRPLSGRTVVVTRAAARAAALIDALKQAGATVLAMPLTRQIEASDGGTTLRAAAATVRENAWVVLTSVNAVDRFMSALRDARDLGGVGVAAVGSATADALRRAGIEPDLIPDEHNARGLVDAFPVRVAADPPLVLFPCGDLAPSTIAEGLGQKGWDVRRAEAYRTVARPAPADDLLQQITTADAVTFAAASAVDAFVGLRNPNGEPVAAPPSVVCIGPTTAAAARAAGLSGVHEASDTSAQGIVDELIAVMRSDGSDGS